MLVICTGREIADLYYLDFALIMWSLPFGPGLGSFFGWSKLRWNLRGGDWRETC